jgi:hypothetical protein
MNKLKVFPLNQGSGLKHGKGKPQKKREDSPRRKNGAGDNAERGLDKDPDPFFF